VESAGGGEFVGAGAVVCGCVCGWRVMLLLFHGVFVDSDGFLAVFGCAVDVAGFFGEDFEEAEVDGLFGRGVFSGWVHQM